MPPDPASQLDQLALEALRKGDAALAARIARVAEELRAHVDDLERTHLRNRPDVRTLPHVEPATERRGARISQAKTKSPARLQELLQERGLSLRGWVMAKPKAKRPSVAAVTSWCRPRDREGRAIPRIWAEAFAAEFQAPELLDPASWPCGIQ